jgi:hypothetical protein
MHNIVSVILIMLAVATVLFASHFFVYWSLIQFFKIIDPGQSTVLAVAIFLLAASFILASILAHWRENAITRGLYFSSGIWLGFVSNLLVMLFVAWVVVVGANLFKININQALIAVLAICISAIITFWGVNNAFNPRIKEISVNIKNLPDYWKGKKVAQISDVHLGHVFKKKHLAKIVGLINSQSVEAVFITGDLFDGMDGKLDLHVEPLNDIKAPAGVYFTTGNHEMYFGLERANNLIAQTKVRILSDESVDLNGLNIIGLNYASQLENISLADIVRQKFGDLSQKPTVLLYHSPDQIDEMKETGVNLQLSGHTHKGQLFPFNIITKMIFRGYDYGLHVHDDYTLYVTSGVGAWGPTVRTANRPEVVVISLQ